MWENLDEITTTKDRVKIGTPPRVPQFCLIHFFFFTNFSRDNQQTLLVERKFLFETKQNTLLNVVED